VGRALTPALGLLLAAASMQPAAAAAASLSLSISPDPTASMASEISWSANSEGPTLVVIAANNPGVPCVSEPSGDTGQTIRPQHLLEDSQLGQFKARSTTRCRPRACRCSDDAEASGQSPPYTMSCDLL
jgi:hypothetical protein